MKLKFLGTGGGRFVTGTQRRRTAGIVVKTDGTQLHLDPGPGALVYSHEELGDPEDTEGVIVSHGHPDHVNDAEAIVEMATEVNNYPGAVFANETVLEGYSNIEKGISGYHQDLCLTVEKLEEGSKQSFRDLEISSQQMFHGDPRTQGIILEDGERRIGFWTDTEFSKELLEFYEGCDVMVIYCSRPRGKGISNHTSIEEVPEIIKESGAGTAIITHFGMAMIDSGVEEEKGWLQNQVDSNVIFAEDGMNFPGNRSLGDF